MFGVSAVFGYNALAVTLFSGNMIEAALWVHYSEQL